MGFMQQSLVGRLCRECTSGYEKAFVRATLKSASEVTDFLCANAAFPLCALEINLERDQINAQHAYAINTTVA